MAIEIDTSDIDMLADMFRRRALYLVPSAMIAGQKRAERHARRRRKRVEGGRRYKVRRRIRYASGNLIAHYVNHLLYLKFKAFFTRHAYQFGLSQFGKHR
jgi:hypothetical protein